jgi:hypothetical protein
MAKYTLAQITGNGSVKIADVHKSREYTNYTITVIATGGFGGGTVKIQISPDEGVTLADLAIGSTVPTIATGQAYTFICGNGHALGDQPSIYATVAGATAATINIVAYDTN